LNYFRKPACDDKSCATDRSDIPVKTCLRSSFWRRLCHNVQRPLAKLLALRQGKRDTAEGRAPRSRRAVQSLEYVVLLRGEAPKKRKRKNRSIKKSRSCEAAFYFYERMSLLSSNSVELIEFIYCFNNCCFIKCELI
jgi:hypothetical protein